jgi:hypothetical protein
VEEKLHYCERVNSRRDIVEHDPGSFRQSFQLTDGRRFDDVEDSKKYKTGEESFPREGNRDKRDQLPGDFVDDDDAGIFLRQGASNPRGRGNADKGYDHGERDENKSADTLRQRMR